MRSPRSSLLPVALLALGALALGCNRADLVSASRASLTQVTAAEIAPPARTVAAAPPPAAPKAAAVAAPARTAAPMFQASLGEQTLDTGTTEAPVITTSNLKRGKVRTTSDEHLPKWVPVKGRLTVVGSADLAENLGLVPKGSTKRSDERISVADKLAEESAARQADPMTRGTSWNFSVKSHIKNHR